MLPIRCLFGFFFVSHRARQDSVLPLLWPVKSADGKAEIKEIALKKGTEIAVSILNANRSKALWGEDADEWKPDRWLSTPPNTINGARLPGVYASM